MDLFQETKAKIRPDNMTAVMMACIPTLMRHRNVMSQDHEHEDVLSSRSNIEQQTICVLATDLGEAIAAPHNVIA